MADITLCACPSCPSSATCRRHPDSGTRGDHPWQSWAVFKPVGDRCDAFVPQTTRETVSQ